MIAVAIRGEYLCAITSAVSLVVTVVNVRFARDIIYISITIYKVFKMHENNLNLSFMQFAFEDDRQLTVWVSIERFPD